MSNKANFFWLWKMAWRDSRKNRGRLLLFLSSIILGIAALVAIHSFGDNLEDDIAAQAKTLLGADLTLETRSDTARYAVDLPVLDSAREVTFVSMVSFPRSNGARLTQVHALEGNFPFYGKLETEPEDAASGFQQGREALVDRGLMLQYDVALGDTVRVGRVSFTISGILDKSPGGTGLESAVAPPVYIPLDHLEATGLIRKGSRVEYRRHYRLAEGTDVDAWEEEHADSLRAALLDADTPSQEQRNTSEAFDNLNDFLGLVAFIALLLGCVGVASSVHLYMRDKVETVAVMRCLGASGRQAFMVFLAQIFVMGLIGGLLGGLLGLAVQQVLPAVLRDFLPVAVSTSVSWPSLAGGLFTGLLMAILFALPPLLRIRRTPPLLAIRQSVETEKMRWDPLVLGVYGLVLLIIFAFAFWQLGRFWEALFFTLALVISLAALLLVSKGIMWAVRRWFPVGWGYVWRQSLANLYRPQNQTMILLATIGLGTALVSTVFYVQGMLLQQVQLTGEGERPNLLLYDIQDDQIEGVRQLVGNEGLEIMQTDPVVNMRVERINGLTREAIEADSTIQIRDWAFRREYRVTYRDEPGPTETIAAGEWKGTAEPGQPVPISMEEGFAERANLKLGDRLTFDVQGLAMETEITSLRKVTWNRVSSNFFVVFPTGVLENAPQFHVLMTRVPDPKASAMFQQTVLKDYPTVSIVNLGLILNTVESLLDKVAFVIRFMAFFSILTGLVVLVSSVILSRFQRLQESVLLRTLGSSRRQILIITLFEYFILGSLASLAGIVLAFAATWALAYFTFDMVFQPPLLPVLVIYLAITGITVLIGFLNSRGILSRPPLEVLRVAE